MQASWLPLGRRHALPRTHHRERVNADLRDEFGGRMIRVRGHAKVMCHLTFGIVALAADQILRLLT